MGLNKVCLLEKAVTSLIFQMRELHPGRNRAGQLHNAR